LWGEKLENSATSTHSVDFAAVQMQCTGVSGDKVIRQTHKYFRYQPGLSQIAVFTSVFSAQKDNLRQRVGLFDGYNGLFFEQDGYNTSVCRRTSASGSTVDNVTNQIDWNLDKMDGTGPSGVTIDLTKTNIFCIDFEWLGSGRVRYGFILNGMPVYCHEINNANLLTVPYMSSPHLPVRYEIENTAATTSNSSMLHICSAVFTEGTFRIFRRVFQSFNSGITTAAVTTRRPVLSIRPKETFNSILNRGIILINSFNTQVDTNGILLELVKGGTIGGAPSWTSGGENSISEFDVAGTTISGGEVVLSRYISSTNPVSAGELKEAISGLRIENGISLNFDGTIQETFSIVATAQTGTANVLAAIDVSELY